MKKEIVLSVYLGIHFSPPNVCFTSQTSFTPFLCCLDDWKSKSENRMTKIVFGF